MLTISVLMSVYKSESANNLDRALRSVWSEQSRKPKEIILIKDGPLGIELNNVINKWKNELGDQLKIIVNETNLGLTKSLNRGLDVIDADLIARMDTDDVSLPERFELQASFLEMHDEVDLLGGSVEMVDAGGNVKYVRYFPENHEKVMRTIYKKSPLPHPGVMMRAEIFKNTIVRYDERYRNSQDIALWFDAIAAGFHIANLNETILRFTEATDVYARRGKVRAKNEFLAFSRGISKIYGKWSPKHIYPILRYAVRCMPSGLIKIMYNSKLYKSTYSH